MRTVLSVLAVGLALVASAPAGADTPAELRKTADAAVDRNFLTPTAETVNAGDLTFNSYEVFFAGLTLGVTDDFQVSATTMLPVVEGTPLIVALSAKVQLVSQPHLRFSVQPSGLMVSSDGNRAGVLGAQLLLDYVVDEDGRFVVSLMESNDFAFGSTEGDLDVLETMFIGFGASAAWQLGGNVKLIGELTLPGGYSNGETELVEEALVLTYGARFFGSSVAADLAFIRPIHPDVDNTISKVLPMGFPFVTFSARF